MAGQYPDSQDYEPSVDYEALKRVGRDLLIAIGLDPSHPSVEDTPRRFAGFWREFIEYNAGKLETTFDAASYDQLVVVSNIRVWSVCEHHLLPFWCDVTIGYKSKEKVLGLSKLARVAHLYAHRPQLQERLVCQIADRVAQLSGSEDVAVMASGEHLCMTMRGIKSEAKMVSSHLSGQFKTDPTLRSEFMAIVNRA